MPPPRPLQAIQAVADMTGVPVADITGRSHRPAIVRARHIAMYVLRYRYGMTTGSIAALFGSGNHSITLHACAMTRRMMTDPEVKRQVEGLIKD